MKKSKTYNIELYLGSINEEKKEEFSYETLVKQVGSFQAAWGKFVPVCISGVEFISGTMFREKGWKISVINFPRLQYSRKHIRKFMLDLGMFLLDEFKQKRICVVDPRNTTMLERPVKEQ